LGVDSNVVAVNVRRRVFGLCGIETESDSLLQFSLKVVSGPSMPQEEELEPCPLTVLPQLARLAKEFRDASDYWLDLVPAHERIQTGRKVGFGRETAAHP
jgi:hypothetical protein